MGRVLIVALAVLLAGTAHAQVYKCKDASGATLFTSQPCTPDAKPIDVRPASGQAGPVDEMTAINNQRIASGRVGPGMTAAQVRGAWGSPSKINQSIYASGVSEQWIYYRGANHSYSQYVYFTNGRVTSVSD